MHRKHSLTPSDFDETLDLVKRIKEKYNVEIHVIKPLDCNSQADFEGKFGKELWKSDPDQYGN